MSAFRVWSAFLAFSAFASTLQAAPDAERRLDARLKILYRAQRPEVSDRQAESASASTERQRPSAEQARGITQRFQGSSPSAAAGTVPALLLLVKYAGDPARLARAGFVVESRIGQIYTGRLDPDRLAELAELPEVVSIQLSQEILAPPAPDRARSRRILKAQPTGSSPSLAPSASAPAPSSFAPSGSAAGAGALVAFIDTGVDVCHDDFRKADNSTRIRFLLDLSDPGDPDGDGQLNGAGPFGGTLYTDADINTSLGVTGFCAGTAASLVNERDTTGHGTHGLSVAAGDDASFPGVAPEAALLVVKATRVDGTLGFQSTDIINALSFINQKAAELALPYVVNLSLGTIFASHDGRSLEEQAIDALVGPGIPGKAAVLAAGNSSDNRSTRYHHFQGRSYVGLGGNHVLTLPAYSSANAGRGNDRMLLDIWHDGNDRNTVTVTTPTGAVVSAPYGDFRDVTTVDGDVFIANMGGADPANGDTEVVILIDDWSGTAPPAGSWTISLEATEIGGSGTYHGWLADESSVGYNLDGAGRNVAVHPYFTSADCAGRTPCEAVVDNNYLVAKPGGAYNGITVGSHAANDPFAPTPASRFHTTWTDVNAIPRTDTSAVVGDISDFSSTGRTRDGRIKPDLTAPGERVMGAVSRNAIPGVDPSSIYQFHPFPEATALLTNNTADHRFGMLQGTSFSAPAVTGLVARILATNRTLDAIQVRNILLNSAVTDTFTGAVPNAAWGWGKASLALAIGGGPLPSDLRILTEALPAGVRNEQYNLVLTGAGGTLPYAWFLVNGTSLPPGLTLSGSLVTGKPTTAGTYNVDLQLADSTVPFQTQTKTFTIVVSANPPLHVVSNSFPVARIDKPYDDQLLAEGGTPPYSWSLAGGTQLPAGLSLQSDGAISGIPTSLTPPKVAFTVQVTDSATATSLRSLHIKVLGAAGDDWSVLGKSNPTINQIAVDPNDANHVFVSTQNIDAVFETTNGGDSWRMISANNNLKSAVAALRVSPTGTSWVIGTSTTWPHWNAVYAYAGETAGWLRRDLVSSLSNSYQLIRDLNFTSTGSVYVNSLASQLAGSKTDLARSTDNGANWTAIATLCGQQDSLSAPNGVGLDFARSDPSRMYAFGGRSDVICASDDTGVTWTNASNGSTARGDIQVNASNAFDVLLVSRTGATYVERSTDGARSWSRYNLNATGPSFMQRAVSDPAVVLVGTSNGLFKSTNHGQSWGAVPIKGSNSAVTAVAIAPSDASTMFVGTAQGMFRSSDGGASWELKSDGLIRRPLNAVSVSRTAPETVALASLEGPYLSRASGSSWTLSSAGITNLSLRRIAISPADSSILFAGTDDGVFNSVNGGVTWSRGDATFAAGVATVALEADPADPNTVVVSLSGSRGTYRSRDRGQSWSSLNVGLPLGTPTDLAFAPDVPGRIYIALSTGDGIYRSEDRGSSWTAFGLNTQTVTAVEPAPSNSEYLYAAAGAAMYYRPGSGAFQAATANPTSPIIALAVDATNPLIAYAGADHPGTTGQTGGVYRTTNGGASWARLPGILDSFDVVSLATHPTVSGVVYAATSNAGVFRSENTNAANPIDVTWTELSNYGTVADLTNTNVQDPGNPFLLYAGTEGYGVQASTNKGQSYVPRVTGLSNYYINALAFDPATPTTLYAGSRAGIFKSTDSANTWAPTALGTGEITDLLTDGTAKLIWATVKGQGVAFSANGGTSFSVSSSGLGSLELTGLDIETVDLEDGGTAKLIWATTRGGDGVYFSDDLGASWKPAGGNGLTDRNVNSVKVQKGTAKLIWATTDNGVFFSSNDGQSWTDRSIGLPSGIPATSVAVDPSSNEVLVSLFSEEGGGVYRGGNTNGVWTAFNSGLDELKVRRLTSGPPRTVGANSVTTFYAATAGDGVFTTDLTTDMTGGPTITTTAFPNGLVRRAYPVTAASATGGTPPYFWSVQGGALPAGLELDGMTGALSGEPAQVGSYSFSLQVSDQSSKITRKDFTLQVLSPDDLHVVSLSPASAVRGTTVNVTVNGSSFLASSTLGFGAEITVNSVTFVDEFRLTANVTVDAGAAPGPRTVTVTNPGPVSATLANGFRVDFPSPVVSTLGTTQGSRKDTLSVTINGSYFDTGATASFGTGVVVNSTTYVSATQLTASITIDAAAPLGAHDVTVTNPNTLAGTATGAFTVRVARPRVTSTSPSQGNQGTSLNVTVIGEDFQSGATTGFGAGVSVNATSFVSATQLTANVTIATGAVLGSRTVTVTNPDGQQGAGTDVFQVKGPAPQVFTTSPSTGVQGTTVNVDVNGSNFQAGATAAFGSGITVNTATFVSASKVTANLTIAAGATVGYRNVTVTNADGQSATLTSGFRVFAPAPTLTSATPDKGSQGTTLNVVLAGTNLQSGAMASFGSGITVNATLFNSTTQLTASVTVSPAATLGLRTVTVTCPDGQVATLASSFQVVLPAPQVSSANPDALSPGQSATVVIKGTGFQPGATLDLGSGISIGVVTIDSSIQITASVTVSMKAEKGARTVVVTNPDGQVSSLPGGLAVLLPPYCSNPAAYNWIDASAGTSTGIVGDDAAATIPIGFTFNFYGVNYTEVTVSSNGYLTFGGSGTAYLNTALPDPRIPNAVVAVFWDDLSAPSAGSITHQLVGTAPNRKLVVQWTAVTRVGVPLPGSATFQAVLEESDNNIALQYQDVVFGANNYDNGKSATVGIEDETGASGVQVGFNTPSLVGGLAVLLGNLGPCCPLIELSTATPPLATVGTAYSHTFTAGGGSGPYVFTVTGSLPGGLTLASGGLLSGTPTGNGTFTFTVTATDASGCQGTRTYTMQVGAAYCPVIGLGPQSLPTATAGVPYRRHLSAKGGSSPYTFVVTAGALPAGINLSKSGQLAGTTTSTGSFGFTATATDTNACTGVKSFTMTVNAP